jgi:hypothetical protein
MVTCPLFDGKPFKSPKFTYKISNISVSIAHKTLTVHYKDQSVNAFYGNNCCLLLKIAGNTKIHCAGKIQRFILLMQMKRIVLSSVNHLVFITIRQSHAIKSKVFMSGCTAYRRRTFLSIVGVRVAKPRNRRSEVCCKYQGTKVTFPYII